MYLQTFSHKNAENPWFSIWKITYKWWVAHIFLHVYRVYIIFIYICADGGLLFLLNPFMLDVSVTTMCTNGVS